MTPEELLSKAVRFRLAPELHVEIRAGGRWSIVGPGREVLNAAGHWEHDPLPSSRSDSFISRTRFDRDDAVERALRELAADPKRFARE